MTRPPAVAARSSCRSALILVLFCFSNNLYGGGAKIFHGLLGLTSYPEALHNLDFAASVSHFPCPPLAKFQAFSWRGLSETLAMSPLECSARPHRLPLCYLLYATPSLASCFCRRIDPTLPVRAARDFGVFCSRPLRSAPAQNPKGCGCAVGD
jgi:hypothetical protein